MPALLKFIIVHFLLLAAVSACAKETLRFSIIENSSAMHYVIPVLKSAYKQLGIEVDFVEYPASRALFESRSGTLDGEAFRTIKFKDSAYKLIRIDVAIAEIEWWIYSKYLNFKIKGVESLQQYRVSTRRGVVVADKISDHAREKLIVNTYALALETLAAARVDLALVPKISAMSLLKDKTLKVHPLKPAIRVDKVYHFLHIKHRDLVPKIQRVLQEMNQRGDLQKSWRQTEAGLLECEQTVAQKLSPTC
ncbi:MAG: transporter substrate-binding domain-containing protein [Bermanella sp.]